MAVLRVLASRSRGLTLDTVQRLPHPCISSPERTYDPEKLLKLPPGVQELRTSSGTRHWLILLYLNPEKCVQPAVTSPDGVVVGSQHHMVCDLCLVAAESCQAPHTPRA
jgi:hypothetical protein